MGTRIRRLFAGAVVVFGFAATAAAQPAPLQGIVQDHAGNPLPGVVVTIAHPQETVVRVVVTDLQGGYAVDQLERGTQYRVRISHPDFRKARLKVWAGDRITVRLNPRRSFRS